MRGVEFCSRSGVAPLADSVDAVRRYALEQHVGKVTTRQPLGTYFSIRLPSGVLRSLKSTLSVCEFGSSLGDEQGISGDVQDVRAAATLAGAASSLSDRGKDLVFFTIIDANIAAAKRIKVDGQQSLSGVQAITCHQLLELDQEAQSCVCSMSPMHVGGVGLAADEHRHATMTLHPAALSTETLLSMWSLEGS